MNVVAGLVLLAQAVVILAIAKPASLPVTASSLEGPPGRGPYGQATLFDLRIDLAVALFLLLAVGDHLTTISLAGLSWRSRWQLTRYPPRSRN